MAGGCGQAADGRRRRAAADGRRRMAGSGGWGAASRISRAADGRAEGRGAVEDGERRTRRAAADGGRGMADSIPDAVMNEHCAR